MSFYAPGSVNVYRRLPQTLAMAITTALAGGHFSIAAADNPAEVRESPTVVVIGTTPLPGLGTPIRDVPANVQIFTGKELGRQHQFNIGEYLEQNATSVTINSTQGNPFQTDVNFRGFTASPVLGTPQGLSVFMDGVRINEPFADVLNWDLIPQSAISSIQLIPGSNPVFGLNAVGGTLGIYTKSGSNYPGGAVEVYGGSFDRKGGEFEYGGKKDKLDYFVTGNYMADDGWAAHNPSTIRQIFGKIGWQDDRTDFDASLALTNNSLHGTQTIPLSFFNDIRQAYTWPDINKNQLAFLTVKGSHFMADDFVLGGNAYYRKYKNDNISSNVNNNFDPANPASAQATNDVSLIDQDSYGFGMQLTWQRPLAGRPNQFTLGVSSDFGKARFTQDEQTAAFAADRSAVGITDFTRITDAQTQNAYYGLFFTDTLRLTPLWSMTASGRYNHARVKIEDESGTAPALNGEHRFSRFNPAVGVNFNPDEQLTAYVTYNEGTRAPTPIELACADPQAPCKLPNNFVSDPALKMVVSKTLEAGLRGKFGQDGTWSVAAYRTELDNDIQFISAGVASTNAGFFENVGKTRRQGIELSVGGKWGGFSADARYSYVEATYQSPFTVNSPANSSADASGNIQVQSGNRIPGIPGQSLKLRVQYALGSQASLGMTMNYSGSVYARNDENNQDRYGKVPGYTVVNLDGQAEVAPGWEVFARVTNLFNRKYANFGILGQNFFTGPGNTFDGNHPVNEQFRGPGAPHALWMGLRYRWL